MPAWARNLVLLGVVSVWGAYILTNVVRGEPIEIAVWGVPVAAYVALNPGAMVRNRDTPADEEGRAPRD